MRIAEREIAWGRRSKSAVNCRLKTGRLDEAEPCHPEQHAADRGKGLRFHLLPAGPQFAGGRGRQFRRRAVIVNRGLRMQRKKEKQGAKRYRQGAPPLLVLHDAKIHCLGQTHSTTYYTYWSNIGERISDRGLLQPRVSAVFTVRLPLCSTTSTRATLHSRILDP
jgi:hypothetical protein